MQCNAQEKEIWTALHGGWLSEAFHRALASAFRPGAVMRRNMLVFDAMTALDIVGELGNNEIVKHIADEMHRKIDLFRTTPYLYSSGSSLGFQFAADHVRDSITQASGKQIMFPKDYLKWLEGRVAYARNFGRSASIRRDLGE